MADPQIAIFKITKEGDRYRFIYQVSPYIDDIVGTTEEIAYLVFDKCVVGPHPDDPNFSGYYAWPLLK